MIFGLTAYCVESASAKYPTGPSEKFSADKTCPRHHKRPPAQVESLSLTSWITSPGLALATISLVVSAALYSVTGIIALATLSSDFTCRTAINEGSVSGQSGCGAGKSVMVRGTVVVALVGVTGTIK